MPELGSQLAPRWELYSHDADVGIRGFGADLGQAFEALGLALTSAICDLTRVRPVLWVEVHCAAQDAESLLYEWINAIVYEMSTRQMLFSRYRVTLADHTLTGTLWGEPLDTARHRPAVEVKGGTYTDLRVQRAESGIWTAQCVIDV